MVFAPYQWRAEHGYLPPPDSMPVPLYFPPPPPWFFPPPGPGQYAAYPGPPPPPYPGCGPVVAVPPPKSKGVKSELPAPPKVDTVKVDKSIAELKSVAPGESCASTVAHFSEAAKSKASKKSGKEKPTNPAAPPSLPPGVNYLFPPRGEHTILHVFNKSSKKVWEGGYKGQKLAFKMFKVATSFCVKGVVENVLKIEKGKGEGWAVTEVVERGGGEWVKVSCCCGFFVGGRWEEGCDLLTLWWCCRARRLSMILTRRRGRWRRWDGDRRGAGICRLCGWLCTAFDGRD